MIGGRKESDPHQLSSLQVSTVYHQQIGNCRYTFRSSIKPDDRTAEAERVRVFRRLSGVISWDMSPKNHYVVVCSAWCVVFHTQYLLLVDYEMFPSLVFPMSRAVVFEPSGGAIQRPDVQKANSSPHRD